MATGDDRSNEIRQHQRDQSSSSPTTFVDASLGASSTAAEIYSDYVTSVASASVIIDRSSDSLPPPLLPADDHRSSSSPEENHQSTPCLIVTIKSPPSQVLLQTGQKLHVDPRDKAGLKSSTNKTGEPELRSMPEDSPSPTPQQGITAPLEASPPQSSPLAVSPSRSTPIRMSSAVETLGAGGGGGGSSSSGNSSSSGSAGVSSGPAPGASSATESEDAAAWRSFCYEHPLHAATSAMLNLGGASALSEDAAVNSVGGNSSSNSSNILVSNYDHHNYAPYSSGSSSSSSKSQQQQQHHQHTLHGTQQHTVHASPTLPQLASASGHIAHSKEDKSMNEIWPSGMGGSHSTTPDDSSGGKELASQQHQQQSVVVVGGNGGEESDIYPLVIKKEPEDLTRRNLRQQQHQHQQHVIHPQHHPDSRIMCTTSGGDKGVAEHQGTVISRVMADGELVHEMIPRLESISSQHSGNMVDGRDPSGGSVIHIRRPLSSSQHDGDAAMLSSAVVLDLARAGISSAGGSQPPQYSSSPYGSNGGSSLQPVNASNHVGYDLTSATGAAAAYGVTEPNAYTTINPSSSTVLRQQHQQQSQQTTYTTPTPVGSDPFYRDYFNNNSSSANNNNDQQQYARAVAQLAYSNSGEVHESAFVDRFIRGQAGVYKQQQGTGLTVDLPSPDSGIGVDAVTPRDQSVAQQNFDYTELCHPGLMSGEPAMDHHSAEPQHHHHHPGNSSAHGGSDEGSRTPTSGGEHSKSSMSPGSGHLNSSRSRSWHDCNRQTEADKIQIPKVMNQYGFRYYLESPISTSQRREDDRITYINKGQFYGITLEYIPDPERPIKNQTVKSMVMLVFREEKSPEDEAKAWQFWHGRQHSAKQRILDADTKNSVGLVGCIEEVSHNAICVYWNPLESSAKINVAVQCLSTDFSSQKGVKGLPLHLQIDTYDDPRDSTPVFHRGYCQVKVFCDKGAERKTRDEERRAAKRKIVVTGRNKRLEELYHVSAERSEFYHMADLAKPPALFTPDDHEKISASMDLPSFYGHDHERKDFLDSHAGLLGNPLAVAGSTATNPAALYSSSPVLKRRKLTPPPCERVMIYVRQENELAFTPLHLVPPTSMGLLDAIESKYKLSASTVNVLYRKNCKGILAKIDDDMLKHYCNEDLFILEITTSTEEGMYDVTLKELYDA